MHCITITTTTTVSRADGKQEEKDTNHGLLLNICELSCYAEQEKTLLRYAIGTEMVGEREDVRRNRSAASASCWIVNLFPLLLKLFLLQVKFMPLILDRLEPSIYILNSLHPYKGSIHFVGRGVKVVELFLLQA
jgi:hypothetical protein